MIGGIDWTAPFDLYCERLGPGFWAEPFNALSNVAFLVAAAVLLVRQRRSAWADAPVTALALLAAVVGFGSFLFHTFANQWSLVADVLPIALFVYAYFFLALRRFLRLGPVAAGLTTAALLLLSPALTALLEPLLGPSAAYAPVFIATLGVAAAVPGFGRGRAPPLLIAAGIAFTIAVGFRMLDHAVCETFPLGTHFLWHTLGAVMVALALVAAERVGPGSACNRYGPAVAPV